MSKLCVFLVILFSLQESFGIIYQLNDTEYEKLPQLFELDNYGSCMEDPGAVYCVANLELYSDVPNDLYTLIQEYSAHSLKHYNYTKIDKAVCVTRLCTKYAETAGLDINRELRSVLEGCMNETMRNKYNLSARMYNMNCDKQTDRDKPVDMIDTIFLTIVMLLVLLNIVGSYYDSSMKENNSEQNHNTTGKEFLLCFSVYQNMKALNTVDQGDSRSNVFKGLHALKVIATCIVVYTHVAITICGNFIADPHTFEKAYEFLGYRIALSSTSAVQVFFVFSGLFLTYLLQVYSETISLTWKLIPKIVFQRWWRLTPPAAVVIGFMATWLRHVSYGPLWESLVIDGPVSQCRQYFWTHIFYFNNYISENTLCAFQTWYIAVDMQVFIVGLIVHFMIMNRSQRFKIITLTALVVAGATINATQVWLYDLDAFAMHRPELVRTPSDPTFRILHVLGHNNLTCFVIGMANGYMAYYLQEKKSNWSNFKMGKVLSWFLIPMYGGVTYLGSLFIRDGDRASILLRMTYAAMSKVLMGFLTTIWLLEIILDCNACSRYVMEWPVWTILSKLSYCVYLVHGPLVHIMLGIRTQLTPVSFLYCFFTYIGVVVNSFAMALLLYLCVEAPACRVIKILMGQKSKKKQS